MAANEAIKVLRSLGWHSVKEAWYNELGNIEFETTEAKWEIDPETGAHRHCGYGQGCFWTDWEE